jgi:pyruvate,orthophosphate dikinase
MGYFPPRNLGYQAYGTPSSWSANETYGQKARNLEVLSAHAQRLGYLVPSAVAFNSRYMYRADLFAYWEHTWRHKLTAIRHHLGNELVCVRSSPEFSMPGLLHTEVAVPTEDKLIWEAVAKVRKSWDAQPAKDFRNLYQLGEEYQMGIIVQDYVAPTKHSWAGTFFSRDPRTGSAEGVCEALKGQSGGALVGGSATPLQTLPATYQRKLRKAAQGLEKVFEGPLDLEFVCKQGKLYLVQARLLKHLTPLAAVRIATDLVREGVLPKEKAESLLKRQDSKAPWWVSVQTSEQPLLTGNSAVSGAVQGRVAIRRDFGPQSLYVAGHTDAIHASDMLKCAGILTHTGGQTCHAAILAMQAGIPAVVGARFSLTDDALFLPDGSVVREGEWLTIDGTTGHVYRGQQPLVTSLPDVN